MPGKMTVVVIWSGMVLPVGNPWPLVIAVAPTYSCCLTMYLAYDALFARTTETVRVPITRTKSANSSSMESIVKTGDEVKLVFRTTSVLPLEQEVRFTEPSAIHLFYIQAVFNVIHANYPCPIETAIKLGGIQIQLTFGNRNASIHKQGYLSDHLYQYVPEHLLPKLKSDEWEIGLFNEHEKHRDKDKTALEVSYLQLVRQWKHYGCTFFKAKVMQSETAFFAEQFSGKVRMGVNQNGVHIIDPKEMKIITHEFSSITNFGSDKNLFWLEVEIEEKSKGVFSKAKSTKKTLHCVSKQAELMNDLVCDWVHEIDSMKDSERLHEIEKHRGKHKTKSVSLADDI